MPNRIIKDSICTSESINQLSEKAEILFYRLIVQCDDHGLFDGRLSIIRTKCFPLKVDSIKEKEIERWLNELCSAGMIGFYSVDGKTYLKMLSWSNHQQVRATHSKYPLPESDDINGYQEISDAPENRIESNQNRIRIESESICKKTPKDKFGEFENVLLSNDELVKLKTDFSDWQERIERLSEYIASSGKKYKDHYATILSWARKDKPTKVSEAERIMRL